MFSFNKILKTKIKSFDNDCAKFITITSGLQEISSGYTPSLIVPVHFRTRRAENPPQLIWILCPPKKI